MPAVIYDKTAEIAVSRKDWMQEVWKSNGWDGESRVTRVEFRYKRECLREMKVEEAYAFLDQIPSLWAYSTKQWLRHTIPNGDPEPRELAAVITLAARAAGQLLLRWHTSCPRASASGGSHAALPDDRWLLDERRRIPDPSAPFSKTTGPTSSFGSGTGSKATCSEKGVSFEQIREAKAARLGVVAAA